MYGLIHQALKDLVTHDHGGATWERICEEIDIPSGDFEALKMYPPILISALLKSTARQLSMGAKTLLERYGRHFVLFLAKTDHLVLLDEGGQNYKEYLKNINRVFEKSKDLMPETNLPLIDYVEIDQNQIELSFVPVRNELTPFYIGALHGLADWFGVAIKTRAIVDEKIPLIQRIQVMIQDEA